MLNFIAGVFLGIAVATIGFTGVAKIADEGVNATKVVLQEQVKK